MTEHIHAYEPTPQQVEDYNAIPAPRCPKCGGRLRFDYETVDHRVGRINGLQFRCTKGRHNVWMLAPQVAQS